MEIPIEILTNKPEIISEKLFDSNQNKDIILDRARIKFQKQTRTLESPEIIISLKVVMQTQFGAASVANFIFDKLSDVGYTKIKIGGKVQRISREKIRESILQQYPK